MRRICHLACRLALLLVCSSAVAQKKTVTGYYLTPQRDTVKGTFTDYAQWRRSPAQVSFLPAGATQAIQLTPVNTLQFSIDGFDEYRTYAGQRLANPIRDGDVFNNYTADAAADSVEQVTTFLRLITRTNGGSIYVLEDAKRVNFYLELPGQPLAELLYKRIFNGRQFQETANFRQQLNQYFASTILEKNIYAKLERLPYTEEELESFMEELFGRKRTANRSDNRKSEWFVAAGVSHNQITMSAEPNTSHIPNQYSCSLSPVFSVGLVAPVSRNFGRYFISPQFSVTRYTGTGTKTIGSYLHRVTYKSDLVASVLLNSGMNVVNGETQRVFVMAGVGLSAQPGASHVIEKKLEGTDNPFVVGEKRNLPNLLTTVEASAGLRLTKKILVLGTYRLPMGIARSVFYSPRLTGVQLKVGYVL